MVPSAAGRPPWALEFSLLGVGSCLEGRISVSWFCCLRLCHLPPILPVDGTDGQFFSSMIHVIFTLSHTIFTNELLDTTLS